MSVETVGSLQRYQRAVMNTFGTPARVLARGQGVWVWDEDGNRYLDLLAGIAVNALGHAHPAIVAAVAEQLSELGHISNLFTSRPQIELAERLLQLADAPTGSRVFLCNSGTEANEAAFKLARRTGRPRILALTGAFHGRTMGSLALTWNPAYRRPFEPLPSGVEHIEAGDLAALEAAMDDDVAALFVEVIQGEAGVLPLPPTYLAAARRLTAQHGALLVIDEIQTGMGRTGTWLAHQLPSYQVAALPAGERIGEAMAWRPDVVTLAKGLGAGMPIGALIAYGSGPATLLSPGDHGTTFGGNPIAAAAALATIGTIESHGLLRAAAEVGSELRDSVAALKDPRIAPIRGAGLLLAIPLRAPIAAAAVRCALDAGYILNAPRPDTIRLAPPLILAPDQARRFAAELPRILDDAERQGDGPPPPARPGSTSLGDALATEGVPEP